MNTKIAKKARAIAVTLALGASVANASALTFNFSQGGFSEGASISGSFSGSDGNGDGFLSYLPFESISELSSFSLVFSGNSSISSFTWGLPELQGFSFKLGGDDVIGNDYDMFAPSAALTEGITGADANYQLFIGEAFSYDPASVKAELSDVGFTVFDASSESASATNGATATVPDTGTTGVLFGCTALMFLAARRRFDRA